MIEDCECDFPGVNVGAGVCQLRVSVKKFWKLLSFNFVPV